MLPLRPGCGFREVCAESFADAGPLGVAKHVGQVQIGRDQRLERAVGHRGLNGAAPVAESLASSWQADAPLMHAQDLGAKNDLVLIEEPLGVGRSQELTHLYGSRLAIPLALPAKPRACEPSRGGRKRASRDPAESAASSLLSASVTGSARVPVGPGAVRATKCSPAKGRSCAPRVEVGRSSLAQVRSSRRRAPTRQAPW